MHNDILRVLVWTRHWSHLLRIDHRHRRFSLELTQNHTVRFELLLVVKVEVLLGSILVYSTAVGSLTIAMDALQIVIEIVV